MKSRKTTILSSEDLRHLENARKAAEHKARTIHVRGHERTISPRLKAYDRINTIYERVERDLYLLSRLTERYGLTNHYARRRLREIVQRARL